MFIYPFFLVHMLGFGSAGFYMSYGDIDITLVEVYLFHGFAFFVYLKFYTALFGLDTLTWIFINSVLGLFGIYTEINWILHIFGKSANDYSYFAHAVPFTYYILYTFLLRRALLDLTKSAENPLRKKRVEIGYVVISAAIYTGIYFA
jgi:hypothetical protein